MPLNTNLTGGAGFNPIDQPAAPTGGSVSQSFGDASTITPPFSPTNNVIDNIGVNTNPVIEQQKFLGATVRAISTTAGWNEQSARVTVSVVEDKRAGDDFILRQDNEQNYQGRLIGAPTSIVVGGFRFDGLIEGVIQRNDFQGNPTFEVTLVSPVVILEGTTVIMSNYVGPSNDSIFNTNSVGRTKTFQLSNFLNVYGYLEGGGSNFGNSLINDTGLLWEGPQGVKQAIETLTNTDQSTLTDVQNFGYHLFYRGHKYKVDLSAIPTAPAFYRLGGSVQMTLLEIISNICQNAGVYYLVKLTLGRGNGPHTISLQIVDITADPSLGKIAEFVSGSNLINSAQIGQELKSTDYTQAMILGGFVTYLQPLENWSPIDPVVMPFWGFDINGNPILGQKPDGTFFADDDHAMNLNASEIAEIMGAVGLPPIYPCNIAELRCALMSYDSWAAYIFIYKRAFAIALGIYSAADVGDIDSYTPKLVGDFINDTPELAEQLGKMNQVGQWTTISNRVYSYVLGQAQTYYGRQFLVKIPFQMQIKIVPDTLQVLYSDEPTEAAFLPEGSTPLGLNFINENFFLTPDGRFQQFFRYAYSSTFTSVAGTKIVNADLSNVDFNQFVVQSDANPFNTKIYTQSSPPEFTPLIRNGLAAGGPIIFVPNLLGLPVPAMVCNVPSPLFAQGTDPLGGVDDIAAILKVPLANLMDAATFRVDSFPMRIHPPAFYPNGVAISLRSNQYTYGPWGKFVADGKVYFEQDESLTPWDYGGYGNLNQGAIAKLATVQTARQVKERGTLVEAGIPRASLGDVLIDGGPNISNIDISIDPGAGITTTYTMESYIPKLGRFNNENADRLKRYGQLYQQMRRQIRQLVLDKNQQQQMLTNNIRGFMQGTSYAVRQQTPHGVMGGHLVYDPISSGYRPQVYMETMRESVANVNAHDDALYQKSACVGLDGLFRAISLDVNASGLPHFSNIDPSLSGISITSNELNPLQPKNDFTWFSYGQQYKGLNPNKKQPSLSDARVMANRGPMLLSGWGYDLIGNPVPNAYDYPSGEIPSVSGNPIIPPYQHYVGEFSDNYLSKSLDWPTGPVDLRWDKFRACWSFPTVLMGWISGIPLEPEGISNMVITDGNGEMTASQDFIDARNFFMFSETVPTGTRVMSIYYPLDNKVYVFAADCHS